MTSRPRIRAADYTHLLQQPSGPQPGSAASSALAAYRKATGRDPEAHALPPDGSAAGRAVKLYRRLTGKEQN